MNLQKEFDKWVKAVYGDRLIEGKQLADLKKAFIAGNVVCWRFMQKAIESDNDDVCVSAIQYLKEEIESECRKLI